MCGRGWGHSLGSGMDGDSLSGGGICGDCVCVDGLCGGDMWGWCVFVQYV